MEQADSVQRESAETKCLLANDLEQLFRNIDSTPSSSLTCLNDKLISDLSGTSGTDAEESRSPFRVETVAKTETLSGWFPKINDTAENSWRIRWSQRNRALLIQIALVVIILTTNLTLTIYTRLRYPSKKGIGLIYQGDCDTIGKLDQWIHLLINVLSTGILSASNYCIQLQASPTRDDIDRAHREHKWLDIGVPSLRNFGYIGKWRRLCWILLAFCALPFHLMYNSAVFQSLASNDYTITVVKDSFIDGDSWNLTIAERNRKGDFAWDESRVNPPRDYHEIISGIQRDTMKGLYNLQNTSDCFSFYNDYWSPQGNGVVFVKNETSPPEDGSLLMYVGIIPRWDNWPKNMWAISNGTGTTQFTATSPPQPVTKWLLGPPRYEVAHCLVQPPDTTTDRCRFQYSTYILYTVCVFNFAIALLMFWVWRMRKRNKRCTKVAIEERGGSHVPSNKDVVLSTLGDAIASFMRDPDETTSNMCLATKDDFCQKQATGGSATERWEATHRPRTWKSTPKRWIFAASWKQWFGLLFMHSVAFLVIGVAIWRVINSFDIRAMPVSAKDIFALGFGTLTPLTYVVANLPREDPIGLLSNVFLVNSPQILFSMVYLFYNAIMSTFLIQREFSLMYSGKKRKPLRVSEPVGIQRSSYFITVPFRYGIPLMAMSMLTHWLISQSFFLARVTALTPEGLVDDDHTFSTCAFSPSPIIILLVVIFIQTVILVLLGCRKYDGTMRMVCTNSMAISAACHSLEEDREYGYQLPVQWGVVSVGDDGVGHCTFTTAPIHLIRQPQEGMTYR
ncbi:hypothetical protein F4804DRAFT_337336 [Jackrogersella minutella]|nr:hypothetical protein F4804DRAFT_337336 [Jackrogersella minutella]